jgi:hypothetical protein
MQRDTKNGRHITYFKDLQQRGYYTYHLLEYWKKG